MQTIITFNTISRTGFPATLTRSRYLPKLGNAVENIHERRCRARHLFQCKVRIIERRWEAIKQGWELPCQVSFCFLPAFRVDRVGITSNASTFTAVSATNRPREIPVGYLELKGSEQTSLHGCLMTHAVKITCKT